MFWVFFVSFGVVFIVIIVFKTPFDALLLLCDICGLLFGLDCFAGLLLG